MQLNTITKKQLFRESTYRRHTHVEHTHTHRRHAHSHTLALTQSLWHDKLLYAPAETHSTHIAEAATFAAPSVVLIEDCGGAVLLIDHRVCTDTTVSCTTANLRMRWMRRFAAIDAAGARLC